MPIDPRMVKWDDKPDPSMVSWDDKRTDTGIGQLVSGKRKPAAYRAADKVGMGNVLGAYDALQHHLLNIPEAIGQLSAHGVNALVQGVAGGTDYAKGVQSRLDAQDAGLRKREADYQARTDGNAGSYAGAVVGEVLPWMVGLGEARAAGLLPKVAKGNGFLGKSAEIAKKTGLLAAEGGTMGLLQPVTGEGSYGAQKGRQVATGAAAAPLLAAGAKGAGAVLGTARYLTPGGRETIAGQRLARQLEKAGVTPDMLDNPSAIAGYTRDIAQAAPNAQTVSMVRSLRNDKNGAGEFFAQQDAANNAALRAQVAQVAGTDADMAAAKAARTAAVKPYFDSLPGQAAPATSILAKIEATSKTGLGQGDRVQTALGKLRAAIEKQSDESGNIDADVLKGIRENFRSYFDHKPTAKELKALEPISDEIAGVLDSSVPGYRDSVAAFRDLSRPINDMEAGRGLLDAIDSGGRDVGSNQAVRLSQVRSQLAKDARSKFPMSPQAREKLAAVMDELQQRTISDNKIAAAGSNTRADMNDHLKGGLLRLGGTGGAGLLGFMFGHVPGAMIGSAAAEGGRLLNRDVTSRMGALAADAPAAAARFRALQSGQPQGLLGAIPDYLMPYPALLPYQR